MKRSRRRRRRCYWHRKTSPEQFPKRSPQPITQKWGSGWGCSSIPHIRCIRIRQERKSLNATENQACPEERRKNQRSNRRFPRMMFLQRGKKKMGDSEAGRKKSWRKTEGVPFSYFEGISLKAQDIACCFQQSAKEYLLCSSVRVPNFFREMQLVSQQRSSFFKPKKEGRPKVARLSLWPRPLQKRWAAHTGRKKQNWQFLDEELLFSLLYLAFKLPSIFCQQKKVIWFFSPRKKSKMQNSCTSKSFFVPCIKHQVCHLRRG